MYYDVYSVACHADDDNDYNCDKKGDVSHRLLGFLVALSC